MKHLLFCFLVLTTLFACENETTEPEPEPEIECSIVGRWIIDGLNESTLYEFTEDLRYTIYKVDSEEFGTIEDAIPGPHDYTFEGDSLIIDLNFGNFSRTVPEFKCDCNVVTLGEGGSVLYQEDYNLADCDE